MQNEYILIMRCPDQPGIMAATSQMVLGWDGDIRDAYSYGDDETGIFFLRFHLTVPNGLGRAAMEESLDGLAGKLGMSWELHDWARKARILIAVSKFDHCLNDLLHRWKIGALDVEIPAVISNHEDARDLVEWHGIPFHHLPVAREGRDQQEARFLELVDGLHIDLVVLARYMQILSPQMCEALRGRCINIHHSFLPSFKGARPYAQAYERGVKIIGATAHYVTPNLDEGPIIEQDVRRVSHATSAREMVATGREIEASVLARAVRWHVEHRVLINGNKTVVFA